MAQTKTGRAPAKPKPEPLPPPADPAALPDAALRAESQALIDMVKYEVGPKKFMSLDLQWQIERVEELLRSTPYSLTENEF